MLRQAARCSTSSPSHARSLWAGFASPKKRILPECEWDERSVRITTPLAGLAQIDSSEVEYMQLIKAEHFEKERTMRNVVFHAWTKEVDDASCSQV